MTVVRRAGWWVGAGLIAVAGLALLTATRCGRGDHATPGVGALTEPGDQSALAGAVDLESALAAARAVELPEFEPRITELGSAAVFASIGASRFVETLEMHVLDASGGTEFALKTEAVHQADPPALHVKGSFRGLRELWRRQHGAAMDGLPADVRDGMFMASLGEWQMLGAGDAFEVIRYRDQLWTRSGGGWSSPGSVRGPGGFDVLEWEWPVARRLSRAFALYLGREPAEADVTINGRRTARYRVENRRLRVRSSQGDYLHQVWPRLTTLPIVPLRRGGEVPEIAAGGLDVWMQDDGLVVQAEYEARLTDGRTFRARAEAGSSGEPGEIRPPE